MRKSKGQTVDLLYTNKKSKKNNKSKRTNTKNNKNNSNQRINLDNEIIIGLTPKREETKKNQKSDRKRKANAKNVGAINSSHRNNKKIKNTKNIETTSTHGHVSSVAHEFAQLIDSRPQKNDNGNTKKSKTKNQNPKKKKNMKFIKWIIIIILAISMVILFMMSSIFNITQIVVSNNNKISSEEIINLSTLVTNVNMFKTTSRTIKNNIKTNPYIEDVKVKRSLNGTITLDIKERIPTYMLKFANSYVYINNQGYILEMSETPLNLPMITGFSTSTDNIKEGNRLNIEDLKKLEDVIKIIESAKSSALFDIITTIDISESMNYKLTIESELKTVQFGEATNINIKLLKIEELIEKEKGVEGEIYFQNSEKTVFREKV